MAVLSAARARLARDVGLAFARRLAAAALLSLVAVSLPAGATDRPYHRLGGDLYAAGRDLRIAETEVADVFAAGASISLETAVAGTVHAAGHEIRIDKAVGGRIYGAGWRVEVAGPVGGDVVAAGHRVLLGPAASVRGDVLLTGRLVDIRGRVEGHANLFGETVEIAAPIAGSVEIHAAEIRFGPDARIGGTLTYRSAAAPVLPAGVIPPERVTGTVSARHGAPRPSGVVGYVVGGLIFLALVVGAAAGLAWLAPRSLVAVHAECIARPLRSLLFGLVVLSAGCGAVPVLVATIVGLPLVPLVLVLLPVLILGGYLTAAHSLGRLLLGRVRLPAGARAFGAIAGGLAALALLGLIPILGWVLALAAVMLGLGGWLAVELGATAAVPENALGRSPETGQG